MKPGWRAVCSVRGHPAALGLRLAVAAYRRTAAAARNLSNGSALCAQTRTETEVYMDTGVFLAILSLFTLAAVLVFALVSKRRTNARLKNPEAHRDENKSRLARDAPDR